MVVVPVGGSARWLARLPVSTLTAAGGGIPPDLVDLLDRLGVRTLGALAALPAGDVLGRFGPTGAAAHRLARGEDAHPPVLASPPPDLTAEATFDPPLERVDTAAFAARTLAEELHQRLAAGRWACTSLLVAAETEDGHVLERRWRHDTAANATSIAEQVRWQLEGWLQGPRAAASGVAALRLIPEELVAASGTALPLWGAPDAPPDRITRGLARLEGLLGPEAVTVAEWRGGRHPAGEVARVPVSTVDLVGRRRGASPPTAAGDPDGPPWPGRLPTPSPATVPHRDARQPVEVVDRTGAPVHVDGRARPSAPPAALAVAGGPWQQITEWAGPWPVAERWWDPSTACRQARFQVISDDGSAYLLALDGGRWSLAAVYN